MKKGVYVDNLTEHDVVTVDDVLKLLLQVGFLWSNILHLNLSLCFIYQCLKFDHVWHDVIVLKNITGHCK